MKQFYLISILIILVSCSNKKTLSKEFQGNAFGTTYTIQFYSENEFGKINVDLLKTVRLVENIPRKN